MVVVCNTCELDVIHCKSILFPIISCFFSEMSEQDIINVSEQGQHVQDLLKEYFPQKTGSCLTVLFLLFKLFVPGSHRCRSFNGQNDAITWIMQTIYNEWLCITVDYLLFWHIFHRYLNWMEFSEVPCYAACSTEHCCIRVFGGENCNYVTVDDCHVRVGSYWLCSCYWNPNRISAVRLEKWCTRHT